MNNNKPKDSATNKSLPRFEFRVFGQGFEDACFRMSRLSIPVAEKFWRRESNEFYIVSRLDESKNIKIRNELLDIKNLIENIQGLERWDAVAKYSFPISGDVLQKNVFSALGVQIPSIENSDYSCDDFLKMVAGNIDLQAVRINKIRHGYMINGTMCEIATVLINGAQLTSLCIESTEVQDILATIQDVGLGEYENTSYPNAIKRVIGFS